MFKIYLISISFKENKKTIHVVNTNILGLPPFAIAPIKFASVWHQRQLICHYFLVFAKYTKTFLNYKGFQSMKAQCQSTMLYVKVQHVNNN